MTKPVTRRLAVDCLLHRVILQFGTPLVVGGEELRPEMDIQFDYVHADVFGGPHEYQNLRPMPRLKHQKKTARDIKDNAKIDRILGLTCTGPTKKIPVRPFHKRRVRCTGCLVNWADVRGLCPGCDAYREHQA